MEKEQNNKQLKEAYNKAKTQLLEQTELEEIQDIGKNSTINKIIKKQKWTVDDLGIMEMWELLNGARQINELPTIEIDTETQKKFYETFKTLNQDEQITLSGYRYLRVWLQRQYNLSLAHIQGKAGTYKDILGKIKNILLVEQFEEFIAEQDKTTIEHYTAFFNKINKENGIAYYKQKENKEEVSFNHSQTYRSYCFLKGYNKAMDIIADFFKIPECKLFKYRGIIYIPSEYKEYNDLLNKTIETIEMQRIGTLEKIQKKALLQEIFKPLKTSYEIPQEQIEQAKQALKTNKFEPFLFGHKDLLNILCAELY